MRDYSLSSWEEFSEGFTYFTCVLSSKLHIIVNVHSMQKTSHSTVALLYHTRNRSRVYPVPLRGRDRSIDLLLQPEKELTVQGLPQSSHLVEGLLYSLQHRGLYVVYLSRFQTCSLFKVFYIRAFSYTARSRVQNLGDLQCAGFSIQVQLVQQRRDIFSDHLIEDKMTKWIMVTSV